MSCVALPCCWSVANALRAACRAVRPRRPGDRRGKDAAGLRPVAFVLSDRIRRRGHRDSVGALSAPDDHQFGVRVHAAARRDPARHRHRQPRHCAAVRPQPASSRRLWLPSGFHGLSVLVAMKLPRDIWTALAQAAPELISANHFMGLHGAMCCRVRWLRVLRFPSWSDWCRRT